MTGWPVPPALCPSCQKLREERREAYIAGDHSRVSDLNVMIRRRHPGTPSDDPAGLEPIPVPDCSVCVALTVERREARAAGDKRTIVEVNREIRAHPHRKTRKR